MEWKLPYKRESSLEHELKYGEVSMIAVESALEIGSYITQGQIHSNNFVKLSDLILDTLNPKNYLQGEREISQYPTWKFFTQVLKSYENKRSGNINYGLGSEMHRKIQAALDGKVEESGNIKISDLLKELVPKVYSMGNDLKAFAKLPLDKQNELKDLTLAISEVSAHYREGFRKGLAA